MKVQTLNGICNRGVCNKNRAYYWNTSTRAYYCVDCTLMIISFPPNENIFENHYNRIPKEYLKGEFEEKITPIDELTGFWSQYRGNSAGRVIHYIEMIAGLRYADTITVGNGKINYYSKDFATIDWSNGYPHMNFLGEYAWMNEKQDELLKKV